MTFTKETGYLLRMLVFLKETGGPVPVRTIAEQMGIPYPFLAKLVQRASRLGWVQSKKGPGGGIQLRVDPAHLRVLDVVEAIEGNVLDRCVLGLPECGDKHPCPLHPYVEPQKRMLAQLFSRLTLEDLEPEIDVETLAQGGAE